MFRFPIARINLKFYLDLQVQSRFEVDIKELPEQIDTSTYSKTSIRYVNLFINCGVSVSDENLQVWRLNVLPTREKFSDAQLYMVDEIT